MAALVLNLGVVAHREGVTAMSLVDMSNDRMCEMNQRKLE